MATANLSLYDIHSVPPAEGMTFGIVVSQWNQAVTGRLLEGAEQTLLKHGVHPDDILVKWVPGSFELTFAASQFIRYKAVDAVIALGCVVRGGTPHFDYVCAGVTQGIAQLNATGSIPVIYGLLTTDTMEQSEERAGGKLGNKGDESAITAIKKDDFARNLAAEACHLSE
ncbi:MAG: 6,7-dimethyl-8-ribityllumazine synthase [Prevotellaceae bacterium]|jgi:6,7-dimethyl-8-ribityllumazine synthase|nr:6,7-dimethyl-8-ribityllumazine synthase [Prevotellaceae bacterium]